MIRAAILALALAPAAAPACEVALVLAIDVSGSVDPAEYRLQMDGLAAALRDPDVREALSFADALLAVTHWSGATRQTPVAGWTEARDPLALAGLIRAVEEAPRVDRHYSTAIGEALAHSEALHDAAPRPCRRRVIDVSGDGLSNEGRPPGPERDRLARRGMQINGLAIEIDEGGVSDHYRAEVIGGGGAFVMTARDFEDYPRAIRRKLLRELSPPIVRTLFPRSRDATISRVSSRGLWR